MKIKVILFVIVPILVAIYISYLKITKYNISYKPELNIKSWNIEAHVKIKGRNKSAKFSLELPVNTSNYEIVSENFVSNGFGVAMLNSIDKNARRAQWSGFAEEKDYDFYYRAKVTLTNSDSLTKLGEAYSSSLNEEQKLLVEDFLKYIKNKKLSEDDFIADLTNELLKGDTESANSLRTKADTDFKKTALLASILIEAGYQARAVSGIKLQNAERSIRFFPWVEVFIKDRWVGVDVRKAKVGISRSWFAWRKSGEPFLITKGVDNPEVSVSVNPEDAMLDRPSIPQSALDKFPSVQRLPIEAQALYRVLLVMPIGALLVAFIRSIIGIKTLGTFMPVLIALSFRETQLFWGLVLYLSIIILSLGARNLFEHLQLLVVPRLTATMTLVVIVIFLFSSVMEYLDLNKALSVALFPIVILTMMIERISVIWEELGLWKATMQTATSLAVASLVYFVISNSYVQYYLMVFPEILLIVLSLSILLGRFTGYRLTELYRFRTFLPKK
jgi:hypothetical protein